MIHPSYVDLMEVVNKDVEEGETPVINSRYSIVMATAKRARQIVDGDEPLVKVSRGEKPLSIAVDELNQGEIRILAEDEVEEEYILPGSEEVIGEEGDEFGEEDGVEVSESEEPAAEAQVFSDEISAVDDSAEEASVLSLREAEDSVEEKLPAEEPVEEELLEEEPVEEVLLEEEPIGGVLSEEVAGENISAEEAGAEA